MLFSVVLTSTVLLSVRMICSPTPVCWSLLPVFPSQGPMTKGGGGGGGRQNYTPPAPLQRHHYN